MPMILIVEDEREIADLIEVYLHNEGYEVIKADSVKEAIAAINDTEIDLALLDVMLPDGNGFSLCQTIRAHHTFPIIMLTAKDEDTDKITGLTLGADDYITKPFKPLELVARIKAQLRRFTTYNAAEEQTTIEKPTFLSHKGLVIDNASHEATLDGMPLALTPTEFSILWILVEENGAVVSAEELSRRIWNDDYYAKDTNTITTHIRHLREKLGDSAEHPAYIRTVWGVGYKLEA